MAIIIKNEELTPEVLAKLSWDEIQWIYNGLDITVTWEIAQVLQARFTPTTERTYKFSRALMAPILEMSLRGTRLDLAQIKKVKTKFSEQHAYIKRNLDRIMYEGIGWPQDKFNYRSPIQLKKLFYEVMELPVVKKRNNAGVYGPSVDREALDTLKAYLPAVAICNHVLYLRELDKKIALLSTKTDADNRMRTTYNIAGTNTGRLSSSASDFDTGTNNQNIDRLLRSIFIADRGMKFCNIDLEQSDSRGVGAIIWNLFYESHGPEYAGAYLDACESGDLHTFVCRMALPSLPWTGDMIKDKLIADDKLNFAYRNFTHRDMAKRLGHGTNFYGTSRTMAKHTKIPFKQIDNFQKNYFEAFPAIGQHGKEIGENNWHRSVADALSATNSITTLMGRQRIFYGREGDAATLRAAIAFEPQSITADVIDTGILRLWHENRVQLLIQVHDSILFQYPEELEDIIVPRSLELLKVKIPLVGGRDFHIPTEAKIGWNWGDYAEDNPSGLSKWKGIGGDSRKRPHIRIPAPQPKIKTLSLKGLL